MHMTDNTQNDCTGMSQDALEPISNGQEYVGAAITTYEQLGLRLTIAPYVKDQRGRVVNIDGLPIVRHSNRERAAIASYIASQPLGYQDTLSKFADHLPRMPSACRLAIQIPSYNEETNIYQTLQEWGSQLSLQGNQLNPLLYEINILNNGPRGYTRDDTLGEIARFKRDFGHVHVNVLDIEFDIEALNVGLARKLFRDLLTGQRRMELCILSLEILIFLG